MREFFWRGVRLSISLGAMLLALAAGACGAGDGGDSGKVQVVTTLPLFADFVREVGGERVEVTSLVPAGADPHTFEPSPSDVKKVAQADIAFANGLDLEPAAERMIAANLKDGVPFVHLANSGFGPRGFPEDIDPHLWLDPKMAKQYARLTNEELQKVDPGGVDVYKANTLAYLDRIDAEQRDASKTLQSVPQENRKLVTTHDAFKWFASAFGVEIIGVVAQGPGQEPSPEDVANLTRAIEEQGVPAVFREPQIDAEGRILEQAAGDAGVQVCTLYSDSLDEKVTSYIEMIRFNADEIARCLGGDSGG